MNTYPHTIQTDYKQFQLTFRK